MRQLWLALVCVALCPAIFVAQSKAVPGTRPTAAPPPIDSICDGNTADLVQNCGFETGDFANWAVVGDQTYVSVDPSAANSGAYGAEFGTIGDSTLLYPGFASDAGSTYHLEFWLANELGGSGTLFQASWSADGMFDDTFVLLELVDSDPFDWQLYTFGSLPVTSDNGGALVLGFRHDPAFWYIDDVDIERQSADGSLVAAQRPTHGMPRAVGRGPFAHGATGRYLARLPVQATGFGRFGFRSPAEAFRSLVQKVKHPVARQYVSAHLAG